MSKHFKKKKFRLTPGVIFRLVLFFIAFFVSVSYFSGNRLNGGSVPAIPVGPNVLGDFTKNIYQGLPPSSRQTVDHLSRLPVTEFITDKVNYLKENSQNFPQKQIKDLQKNLIKIMADELINKVDNQ